MWKKSPERNPSFSLATEQSNHRQSFPGQAEQLLSGSILYPELSHGLPSLVQSTDLLSHQEFQSVWIPPSQFQTHKYDKGVRVLLFCLSMKEP